MNLSLFRPSMRSSKRHIYQVSKRTFKATSISQNSQIQPPPKAASQENESPEKSANLDEFIDWFTDENPSSPSSRHQDGTRESDGKREEDEHKKINDAQLQMEQGKVNVSGILASKKVLVTGGSRGIGLEIAKRFTSEGAICTLIGRDKEKLESAVKEVGGEGTKFMVGDVGKVGFWNWGHLEKDEKAFDILVNAAGLTHASPFFVTSTGMLEDIVQTNLMGTMLACRAIGKHMLPKREGCIINISSLLGMKGGKGSAGYAASKAGVIGLTRALAGELGVKGIRVNVIVPGYIETDMTKAMASQARKVALDAIPLKRFGEASEIADAAVFLAANKYANNCVLNLDGGLSAR